MKIITFIRNLIKRGVVTRATDDTGQFAIAQVQWIAGKSGNVEVVYPYGVSGYAPVGSLALMFNVMGHESNRAAIINNPKIRFKDLKEGEVAIGNFLTRSYIKFLENGDIEVIGVASQNVTITGDVNLTIGGNCNIIATGNINATAANLTANISGNADITCPQVDITGALSVTGDVTAFAGGVNEITFSDIISTYNSHTHNETGSVTNAPNQPLP
jgi:phage gp45-like